MGVSTLQSVHLIATLPTACLTVPFFGIYSVNGTRIDPESGGPGVASFPFYSSDRPCGHSAPKGAGGRAGNPRSGWRHTASLFGFGAAYHLSAEYPASDSRLPRLRRTHRSRIGLYKLHPVRMGQVRVSAAGRLVGSPPGGWEAGKQERPGKEERLHEVAPQIDLLPSLPAYQPTSLPVLDERSRGTKFIGLPVNSVLNTPASTGMGFWSINPYVGCEFGCTYCYARDTHRWVLERADGRTGGRVVGAFPEPSEGGHSGEERSGRGPTTRP